LSPCAEGGNGQERGVDETMAGMGTWMDEKTNQVAERGQTRGGTEGEDGRKYASLTTLVARSPEGEKGAPTRCQWCNDVERR
jgi:hypothetical protein